MVDKTYEIYEKNEDLNIFLPGAPSTKLGMEMELRPMLARSYAELRRTAAEGKAPEHEAVGIPMAALAARTGKISLAHELVSRGDDPNNVLHSDGSLISGEVNESSFQSAIACVPLALDAEEAVQVPVAERLALLEHMLAHGAALTIPQPEGGMDARRFTLAIALISALRGDEGAMLEWLLEKGLAPLSAQERGSCRLILSMGESTLPTMRRIVEKYYGELSDSDRYHLLRGCICNRKDAPQKLRWALTELHADPNATLSESDENGVPNALSSAMQEFCRTLLFDLQGSLADEEDSKHLCPDQVLEMLDLLLAHGAELPEPEKFLPTDETLRQKYKEVINKYK